MGNIKDKESRVIVRKLLFCFPLFEAIYFAVAAVFFAAFGLFDSEDPGKIFAKIPYDIFLRGDVSFSFHNDCHLVAWLSLVTTYLLGVGIIFWIVRSTAMAWDYTVTLSVFHMITCCIVSGAFPTNWVWWASTTASTCAMAVLGELSCYKLRDLKEIDLDH